MKWGWLFEVEGEGEAGVVEGEVGVRWLFEGEAEGEAERSP